ncbi:MAG: esterase-like activity of phytase family protein [Phycisphaerae bacterium]
MDTPNPPRTPARRHRLLSFLASATLIASGQCTGAQTLGLHFRGTFPLSNIATDQNGQAFTVTGLSGLAWIGDTRYVAVMDNSDKIVFLDIDLSSNGTIQRATISGGLTLAESHDYEGITYTTDQRNSVFLAEEDTPAVREFALSDGALLQILDTPPIFLTRRHNLGFESLSRHPDGTDLWTANEEALPLDGSVSTVLTGSTVRILRYALTNETGTPGEQYVYNTAPIHGGTINGSRSGLVELVVLPDGRMLALERSIAFSVPNFFQNRLYELEFTIATDVSSLVNGLIGETFTPVDKHLLWSGNLGNLEGLALGPLLTGGNRSLLGVVDDGDALSTHQLVAFELLEAVP